MHCPAYHASRLSNPNPTAHLFPAPRIHQTNREAHRSLRQQRQHAPCCSHLHAPPHAPDIVAYNVLFKAFAQNNEWSCIISRFNALLAMPHAPPPDECILTHVIKACSRLAQELEGRKVHCFVTKHGRDSNLWVGNSLMDFYFKVGNFRVAHKLFDELPVRDVVSWNILISGYCLSGDVDKATRIFDGMVERDVVSWSAMIAGYVQNEKYGDAIDLFLQMQQQSGLVINTVTLVSVLSACARLCALDTGKWIHGFIRQSKMKLNLSLGNALVDMYSKCGCIVDARRVFDAMEEKNVISWSTIIIGLAGMLMKLSIVNRMYSFRNGG